MPIPMIRFKEIDALQNAMNQLFERQRINQLENEVFSTYPYTNIFDKGNGELEVRLPLPGIDINSVDITLVQGKLVIAGERKSDRIENAKSIRSEREYGKFRKVIDLPIRINHDLTKASYANGVLHINLIQAEEDKPIKINIS